MLFGGLQILAVSLVPLCGCIHAALQLQLSRL